MNSESNVYFLFVIIYLIIFYLYYNDYYVQRESFNNTPDYLSDTITSQIKTEYYKDLSAIQNISRVAQMLNTTNNITLTNLKIQGRLNLLPPGLVTAYVGLTSPDGWLICDGSVVSKLDYPKLYIIIGDTFNKTTYSSSILDNNFNLPDYRGVFLRGYGAPGLNINMNMKYTSSQLNTIQYSALQEHTHELVDPGHTHTYNMYYTKGDGKDIDYKSTRDGIDHCVYSGIGGWGGDKDKNNGDLVMDKNSEIGGFTHNDEINITNIKTTQPNGLNKFNISTQDIFPCNMTINWIIKY